MTRARLYAENNSTAKEGNFTCQYMAWKASSARCSFVTTVKRPKCCVEMSMGDLDIAWFWS
jgi:hypothetical protein